LPKAELINMKNIWDSFVRWVLMMMPHHDSFRELSSRKRTVISIGKFGYQLDRSLDIAKPANGQNAPQPAEDSSTIARSLRRAEEVVLAVDADRCLLRQIRIPSTARAKIADILKLNMLRSTPFVSESVYSAWWENERGGEHRFLDINHAIIRKDHLEPISNKVGEAGARVLAIIVRAPTGQFQPIAISPSGNKFGSRELAIWSKAALFGTVATVLAGLALVAVISIVQSRTSATIAEQSSDLENISTGVRMRLDEAKKRSLEISALQSHKASIIPATAIIEELSAAMPDSAFLSSISMDSENVTLDGEAKEPEPLIAALENNRSFKDVTFASPVFKAPGEERSHFSIKLKLEKSPQ
jgi:general secretion pathway protein L